MDKVLIKKIKKVRKDIAEYKSDIEIIKNTILRLQGAHLIIIQQNKNLLHKYK